MTPPMSTPRPIAVGLAEGSLQQGAFGSEAHRCEGIGRIGATGRFCAGAKRGGNGDNIASTIVSVGMKSMLQNVEQKRITPRAPLTCRIQESQSPRCPCTWRCDTQPRSVVMRRDLMQAPHHHHRAAVEAGRHAQECQCRVAAPMHWVCPPATRRRPDTCDSLPIRERLRKRGIVHVIARVQGTVCRRLRTFWVGSVLAAASHRYNRPSRALLWAGESAAARGGADTNNDMMPASRIVDLHSEDEARGGGGG